MGFDERRRGRGRGRGRGGGGRQASRRDKGPQLPMRLAKELGFPTPAAEPARGRGGGRGRGRSGGRHMQVRGTASKAHDIAPVESKLASQQVADTPARSGTGRPANESKKSVERPLSGGAPGKRKQPEAPAAPSPFEAEERLQAQLAKKLKVKKGQKLTGPEDGLDDLLAGMEDVLEPLPHSMNAHAAHQSSSEEASEGEDAGSAASSDSELDDDLPTSDDDDTADSDSQEPSEEGEPSLSGAGRLAPADQVHDSDASDSGSGGSSDDHSARLPPGGPPPSAAGEEPRSKQAASSAEAARYVPPALRARQEHAATGDCSTRTQDRAGGEHARELHVVRRQVRSLLNRVASANLAPIAQQIAAIFSEVPRHAVVEAITASTMQALAEGPRAVDQFASVTASLVSLVAALVPAQDLLAKWVHLLAQGLEDARRADDSIASGNIVRVLCHLYLCKAIGSDVVFSLLEHLKASFSDGDVTLIVSTLHGVGLALRSDDAPGMKAFVLAVHGRAAELGAQGALSQRARLMLDLVVDIKNNRRRGDGAGGRTASLPPALAKVLRESNVEGVSLQQLPWSKILTCSKKGLWWQPQAHEGQAAPLAPVASTSGRPAEEQHIVRLAASQRMNTDSRRAVFSVIMAADDYLDAAERLLRLPLKGTAERDVARVIVQCCLQERDYNPYYALVMARVAAARRTHRMTLQNVVRDRLQELAELAPRQAMNFSRFLAAVLASQAASVASLKPVEFSALQGKQLAFFRTCVCHLLLSAKGADAVEQIFGQAARHEELHTGLKRFLRHVLAPELLKPGAGALHLSDEQLDVALVRLRRAERGLKAPQRHT